MPPGLHESNQYSWGWVRRGQSLFNIEAARMSPSPNKPSTIFAVVRLREGHFAVEMTRPGEATVSIKPFFTEREAEEWIAVEKRRTEHDDG